jgi:hypothetical protein
MIVDALMAACFFAAVVAVLSVPWMTGVDEPSEAHPRHH